jgi:hypothetical protein
MNQMGSKKRCRTCGGIISSTSTVCRHCGTMIQPVILNKKVHQRKRLPFGDFLISIVFGSLTILFLTAVTLIVMPAHPTRASAAIPPGSPVAVSPATIVISAPKENLTFVQPEIVNAAVVNTVAAQPGVAGSGVVPQPGVSGSGVVGTGVVEPPVYGQGGTCISGTIIDIYEQPVSVGSWIITVANAATPGNILDSVIADSTGVFNFPTDGHPAFAAGTYIVTLQVPEGWQSYTPIQFSLTLNGNADVDCAHIRFKMEALANLKVTKLDQNGPVGIPGWVFEATYNGEVQQATTDGLGNAYFSNLPPGKWMVSEKDQVGWQSVGSNPQSIDLESPRIPGTYQTLTVINQQLGVASIKVVKTDTAGAMLDGWHIDLTRPDGTQPPQVGFTGATTDTGTVIFDNLSLGQWSIDEVLPADPYWRLVSANPQTVDLDTPGVQKMVTIVNEELGCVDGYKINQLEQGLPGWKITAHKASGDEKDLVQVTGADGYFQFYLSLGTWTISEELQDGWTPVTPASFDVAVTQGHVCEHVRFKNSTKYACVDAYKKDIFDGIGLPGWQISLRPEYGTDAQTQIKVTDGTGWVRFNQLTPGVYRIWEVLQEGWTQMQVNAGYYPGTLSIAPLNYDNSTTITLEASGSCKAVEFYNQQNNRIDP